MFAINMVVVGMVIMDIKDDFNKGEANMVKESSRNMLILNICGFCNGNIEVNTDTKVNLYAVNMIVDKMVIIATKDDFYKGEASSSLCTMFTCCTSKPPLVNVVEFINGTMVTMDDVNEVEVYIGIIDNLNKGEGPWHSCKNTIGDGGSTAL